jgi:glycosyltransferase involved in cell wall biosynthesis
VKPYWSKGTVFSNILRGGAGTSLKVAEALASGIPMVSTATGVRGYAQLSEGQHYLHAESAEDFAERICDVLAAPAAFSDMTRAGRAVAEQLGWSALAERYAQVIEAAFG